MGVNNNGGHFRWQIALLRPPGRTEQTQTVSRPGLELSSLLERSPPPTTAAAGVKVSPTHLAQDVVEDSPVRGSADAAGALRRQLGKPDNGPEGGTLKLGQRLGPGAAVRQACPRISCRQQPCVG